MKEQTFYREKTYVCGEYLDVYIYPVYKQPGKRSGRAKPSTETQQKLNARHSAEQLVRKLHANFTPMDLSLGLDYAENPEDEEQAKRDIQNFIRRLRRLRAKRGLPPLKYITVTEKSGSGRYHHHIVVNAGIDRDELEALWGFGHANTKRLQFNEKGVSDLGHYIVKSPIFRKRWNASKNLIDPEPKTNDNRIRSRRKAAELAQDRTDREPWEKLYPDYILAEVTPFHNDLTGGIYLFARLYRKDGQFMKPRRKRGRK